MQNKKPQLFIFKIIAIILGGALFKQFDFKTLKFEKPWLALVYAITFVFSVYTLIKNRENQSEK